MTRTAINWLTGSFDPKRINCDCLAIMKAVLCFRKTRAALALVHSGA
jgi:hypothetical protein